MPLNLDETGHERTRWIDLDGHLEGVSILVRFCGPEEMQKFRAKMMADGIIRASRDNPFDINAGREKAFFQAVATKLVIDWRGDITPKDSPYDPIQMGRVLAAYRLAFDRLMEEVAQETRFFSPGVNGSTPS